MDPKCRGKAEDLTSRVSDVSRMTCRDVSANSLLADYAVHRSAAPSLVVSVWFFSDYSNTEFVQVITIGLQ